MPNNLMSRAGTPPRQPGRHQVGTAQEELRLDDLAAQDQRRRDAVRAANAQAMQIALAPVFRSAIERWGKLEAYAAAIGTDKGTLSKMCSGERLIGPRDTAPLREVPEAWSAWVRGQAQIGGLAVVVRRQGAPDWADVQDALTRVVLRNPWLRDKVLEDVAAELGVARGDVDEAVDDRQEPSTNPGYWPNQEARP